jgi:NAD(P)H dehydrogenase (quinone)
MPAFKILILVGHPMNNSFGAAMAERYAAPLRQAGAEVRIMQLSEMDLAIDLTTRKPGDAQMIGDTAAFWQVLTWCDHFVLVHPLWWGGMPAKLKGLFDHVLQSGKAFRYEKGQALPTGLLKGRTARLIVTSDTPDWFMWLGYGCAHFRQVRDQILRFVGFSKVRFSHASVLQGSTPLQRDRMLDMAERHGGQDLGLAA